MLNFFDCVDDPSVLQADLPPGMVLWWVRGKVLHTEVIERPGYQHQASFRKTLPYPASEELGPVRYTDTLIALHDRDDLLKAYEIRLHGRVDAIAPGDKLELLGHTTPHQQAFVPRMAFSINKNWWWPSFPALHPGQPGFIVEHTVPWKGPHTNTHNNEPDGWFMVSVPAPIAAPPVPPPAPAPAPRSAFGLLLGGAAKLAASAAAAAAPPAPAFVWFDVLPVYKELIPALADDDPETAAQNDYDDDDDLPPP